jgi:AAA domain
MATLLDDVSCGRVNISTLTGPQFQKLVFEKLLVELFADRNVITVTDAEQGPVDYIVTEIAGSGMLGANRVHYFECKNYSRTLELDNVAKIMVVAVADQPTSVHVVSRTGLQPQIVRYASRIFNLDTPGSPIFRSIVFRHWQTDRLLNFVRTNFTEHEQATQQQGNSSVAWWVSECAAFSETEIASSDSPSGHMTIRRGRPLLLTLDLPGSRLAHVELLGVPDGCWTPIESSENGSATRFSYLIDTMSLAPGTSYTASVKVSRGVTDTRIPLGNIRVGASASLLPELRLDEVDNLTHQIGLSGDYRLLLVDGEAGVGKTHLIERVSERLRARDGFDVMCFTITDGNSPSLMAALLQGCLTPPLNRDSFQQVADAVQRVLLPADSTMRTPDANVSLLARIATRMGPRVIVLRDCQHLTDQVANELWSLLVALDDAGWGGLRLVLEFRQPDAMYNPALKALVANVNLKIRNVLLQKTLAALNFEQFTLAMKGTFSVVTENIVACIFTRTGGLPLFIEAYLRRLLGLGFVTGPANGSATLSISHPAQVLADDLPVGGQVVLEDRIRAWLRDKFASSCDTSQVELGLLAIAEDGAGQALMKEALHLSDDRVRAIQIALDEAALGYGRPDGQIAFRHDLFRVAMVSVAKSAPGFLVKARAVADEIIQRVSEGNEPQIRSIRSKIFNLVGDRVALEVELRLGATAAERASDYGRLISFLSELLNLLSGRSNLEERLNLMSVLAWAAWVSDSLVVARQMYLKIAEEAEKDTTGDFSMSEAAATDAYRRAIGVDLELMEPIEFLQNSVNVLKRRQTLTTFNSVMNRLVLFCARFGYPDNGFKFAQTAYGYIGKGTEENEGAVLCSEVGALYAPSDPRSAQRLFEKGIEMAADDCQRSYNILDLVILKSLHLGQDLDLTQFGSVWKICTEKRFSEILARASLLRGSLFLRNGDIRNAHNWIDRTATMVNLYSLKEFELAVLSDQLLLSMLERNHDMARRRLFVLANEFDRILKPRESMLPLVEQAYDEACRAATKLPATASDIDWPRQAPRYCNSLGELWRNISVISARLGCTEIESRYKSYPLCLGAISERNLHRYVSIDGLDLALGAY